MSQKFELAVPTPQLPPTAEEARAVEEVRQRYSAPLSSQRLAYLESLGKKPDIDCGTF